MTFSCRNFDFNTENCLKLNTACIPGRRGCILVGRVKFGEALEKKLQELERENKEGEKGRHREKRDRIIYHVLW